MGASVANDDWGFNTSTLLAPEELRRLVFPWYQRIVELVHSVGRGGFALGTGNSVPEYVPDANYFALIRAALD